MIETASEKLNSMLKAHKFTDEQEDGIMENRILPVEDALEVMENKMITAEKYSETLNHNIWKVKLMDKGTWVVLQEDGDAHEVSYRELFEAIK